MGVFPRNPRLGLPRQQAGWISAAWLLLGTCAILAALLPLQRDLRRRAELELLSWLKSEGDALLPLVERSERQHLDATAYLPARRESTLGPAVPPCYASQAQLWLVSAAGVEPGLIVPVSTDAVAPASLRDFSLLQAGVAAARSGVTRPFALVDGPAGRQVVAYLRLAGTSYGIATSMDAELLYGQVTPRLVAVAAVAATLLAAACAGLLWVLAAPAGQIPAPPAVPLCPGATSTAACPSPAEATVRRLEGDLQRILYHTATLEHEGKADPQLLEHLAEIREAARQGLTDLRPEPPAKAP